MSLIQYTISDKNALDLSNPKTETFRTTFSYDLPDSEEFYTSEDETFLIDSAKVKLHEPVKTGTVKSVKKISANRRRSSVLSRKFQSYDSYHNSSKVAGNRRTSEFSDFHSRRSSLQDLNAEKPIAPDERLAERVLNWLDLAGNEDFLKNLNECKEMEVKLTKTTKLRRDSIKKTLSKNWSGNHNSGLPKLKAPKVKLNHLGSADKSLRDSSSEAVKHITIIFNKEGQPIRFNRPAKNIDLCALSTSPGTTRRLAGSLASARLYKSAENSRLHSERSLEGKIKKTGGSTGAYSARRRLDTVADLTNSNLQKRLKDTAVMGSYNSLHDAKKQLHIFMPTLPKKGVATTCGTEDGISELSQNLSEYCRV